MFSCHIRHFKSIKNTSWKSNKNKAKANRRMVNDFDYVDIKFLVCKKDYCKTEENNSICVNVF